MGSVVSIHRVSRRDGEAVELDAATFVANRGLEGDWRSRTGRGRQITVIEAEALEQAAQVLGRGAIAAGASRRQIVVRGIALNDTVGRRLRIGQVVVKVEALCDPCRKLERSIGPGALAALREHGGVCGRVLEGGVVRPGDAVGAVDG